MTLKTIHRQWKVPSIRLVESDGAGCPPLQPPIEPIDEGRSRANASWPIVFISAFGILSAVMIGSGAIVVVAYLLASKAI